MVNNVHAHTCMRSIHSLQFGCVQFRISEVRYLEIEGVQFGIWKCVILDLEVWNV